MVARGRRVGAGSWGPRRPAPGGCFLRPAGRAAGCSPHPRRRSPGRGFERSAAAVPSRASGATPLMLPVAVSMWAAAGVSSPEPPPPLGDHDHDPDQNGRGQHPGDPVAEDQPLPRRLRLALLGLEPRGSKALLLLLAGRHPAGQGSGRLLTGLRPRSLAARRWRPCGRRSAKTWSRKRGQLVVQPRGGEAPLEDRVGVHHPGVRDLLDQHVGVGERVERVVGMPDDERRVLDPPDAPPEAARRPRTGPPPAPLARNRGRAAASRARCPGGSGCGEPAGAPARRRSSSGPPKRRARSIGVKISAAPSSASSSTGISMNSPPALSGWWTASSRVTFAPSDVPPTTGARSPR